MGILEHPNDHKSITNNDKNRAPCSALISKKEKVLVQERLQREGSVVIEVHCIQLRFSPGHFSVSGSATPQQGL